MKRLLSLVLLVWPFTPSFGGQHSGIGPASPAVPERVPPFPRPSGNDDIRLIRPFENVGPLDKQPKKDQSRDQDRPNPIRPR